MKKLALVLFLVLAAAGLWWWESPRLATENLLDAAHGRDLAELETLIEADTLRASLRKLPTTGPTKVAAPSVTSRVPGDPLLADLSRDTDLVALNLAMRTEWEIDRQGLNVFRVLRRTGAGEALPTLLFARDGLHWKLVRVERAS